MEGTGGEPPAAPTCCSGDAEASCGGDKPCCTSLLCIAVVRPDHSAVDVYDSKGKSRTFRADPKAVLSAAGSNGGTKLCFSTHGAGNGADGLLSPCFDENGEHGEPEEGCF